MTCPANLSRAGLLSFPESSRADSLRRKQPESRQHLLNRFPDPQGQRSFRPNFSDSSLLPWTIRTPRFTFVSDGKPLRRLLIVSKKGMLVEVLLVHGAPPFLGRIGMDTDLGNRFRGRTVDDVMFQKWSDLLRAWAVDPIQARPAFDEVSYRYSEPGRFYHTSDHVQAVLDTVESLGSSASNLNAVKLAVWLHDVIYDSKASDNEERSAEFAERLCQNLSISEGRVVASLILKTKSHDAEDDPDAKVLLDADLAILGASARDYQNYAKQIRQEFAWVTEPNYRSGRQQVLTRFLIRPRIFHFLSHLEEPARRNISAEIAQLAGE